MANGFGSLYVGSSGLQSAQNALNVTANNLSNIDTTGYVRQQVRFTDKEYATLKQTTSNTNIHQSGIGVSIGDVVHARDIFLDKAYRQENGRAAFYSTMYEGVSNVEDMFQELDGQQFKQSVEDLWKSFQEFAKAPADSTNQNLVAQKAELFVSRCQSLYSDLQSYQANLNKQIYDDIQTVNDIGNRIYDLNLQIQKVEASKVETAMTLRDERDNLLDELGKYGSITFSEDQTGFVTVAMEGVDFVDEHRCNNIALKTENGTGFYTPYWPYISDASKDEYVPVFHLDQTISTEFNTDVGKIKALMVSRGDGYGRYGDLDTEESYSKVQDCTVMETQAEVDKLFHTVVNTLNDIFAPNTETTAPITTTEGITYPAGTKILDTENCAVGADKKLPPQELFTRMGVERYKEVTGTDGKTYYIFNEEKAEDTSSQYIIGNTQLNPELKKQITKMPSLKMDGAVDYGTAQKLAAVWDERIMTINPTDNTPSTFQGYYDKIIGRLGTAGNTYSSASDTVTNTVASVNNQRSQVTGVSSDEELTKMVKYQSAYNAASRYITVISQMTELIVTGLI